MFQQLKNQYRLELKRIRKKKFYFKTKLLVTVVLPIFLMILFIKVIKTFLQIKIRNLFARPLPPKAVSEKPAKPVPVKKIPVEKEILHPIPVSKNL